MSGSGDYISREAAIKRFTFATLDCLGMEPTIRASDVVLALQSIPAADVRPVRRGEWTTEHLASTGGGTYAVVRCSECSSQFPMWRTNFCPNCGADMMSQPPKEE